MFRRVWYWWTRGYQLRRLRRDAVILELEMRFISCGQRNTPQQLADLLDFRKDVCERAKLLRVEVPMPPKYELVAR